MFGLPLYSEKCQDHRGDTFGGPVLKIEHSSDRRSRAPISTCSLVERVVGMAGVHEKRPDHVVVTWKAVDPKSCIFCSRGKARSIGHFSKLAFLRAVGMCMVLRRWLVLQASSRSASRSMPPVRSTRLTSRCADIRLTDRSRTSRARAWDVRDDGPGQEAKLRIPPDPIH